MRFIFDKLRTKTTIFEKLARARYSLLTFAKPLLITIQLLNAELFRKQIKTVE